MNETPPPGLEPKVTEDNALGMLRVEIGILVVQLKMALNHNNKMLQGKGQTLDAVGAAEVQAESTVYRETIAALEKILAKSKKDFPSD